MLARLRMIGQLPPGASVGETLSRGRHFGVTFDLSAHC